jgi:CubicO group peptidase (beta-lactamase class C family)
MSAALLAAGPDEAEGVAWMSVDLGGLVELTAKPLTAKHVWVVVAAVAGDSAEIRCAGTTGPSDPGEPAENTLFEIGSITKVFTALTLARDSLAGTVDLDEPVRQLLPPAVNVPSRGGKEITLRHLATHTSGLPRLPKGMLLPALLHPNTPDPYAGLSAEVIFEGLARTRLHTDPGRRFRYSNLGGGLLGLALAHRAGISYEALIERDICQPLGLGDTVITLDADQGRRMARGHTRRKQVTPLWNLNALAGAGALRSTATDLVRFARAQLDPPSTALANAIELSHQPHHQINRWVAMRLGWMATRLRSRAGDAEMFWHNGGTGGFRSFIGFVPAKQTAVVVLSNTARSVDRPATQLIRAIALGTRLPGAAPRAR